MLNGSVDGSVNGSRGREPADRAGRGLGTERAGATTAVVADRFDTMAWRESYDQVTGLRRLARELNARHDHTEDLLTDVFLAAYKVNPRVRERTEMDPARLVNHLVLTALTDSPEFADLRRETCGVPYAAATAVLAQADALHRMLAWAGEAVARARRQTPPPETGTAALTGAVTAAESADTAAAQAAGEAERALASAVPPLRATARRSVADAADQAREESALMRAWGVAPGELERMPFEQRARLAERLRHGRLGAFADLIGRFRQMASSERARKVENAPGELVGITLGDDLSRIVPSELASLGVPALRGVFAARYAEARLMLYEGRGEQTTGKGAIVACVDCSNSMSRSGPEGITGEAWAKACALALLDQARQARREFVGILFSSARNVQVYRFPAARPAGVADVLDFVEHFFGAGTDYQAPLSAAVGLLEEEFAADGRQRGDIVLITDGECDVTEEWMRGWNAAKHRLGFRSFGVAIGTPATVEPGSVLDALCDNLRQITDLTDTHAAGDLFRVI